MRKTAAITINENAAPSVKRDMLLKTGKLIPREDAHYRHAEGNSDSHIKSSFFGSSESVILKSGRLLPGTWQGVYFADDDICNPPTLRKRFT